MKFGRGKEKKISRTPQDRIGINVKHKYGEVMQQVKELKGNADNVILDYTRVINKVSPSLVTISDAEDKLNSDSYFEGNVTGIIINDSGIILTNYSAIKGKSDIYVKLSSVASKPIKAQILMENEGIDLAIIKIEFDGELKAIKLADLDNIKEGQGIVVLGNAIGDEYIGNSKGELVGIANLSITNQKNEDGLYYGLQMKELQEIINSTNSFKSTLGIVEGGIVVDKEREFSGFYIQELSKDGSAYMAGIKPTDIIVEIDGYEVVEVDDMISILQGEQKDDILHCKVLSDGEMKDVDIKILR